MLRSKLARPTRGSAATGRRALRNWAGGREDVRFQFKCTQCGKCCTGRGGRVRVNERELARIASATGESIAAVQRKFVRRGPEPGQWLLRQTDDDSRCVFLDGTKCSIYKARPTQCQTYPWWPQNVISDYDWHVTARECEGISVGSGDEGQPTREEDKPVYSYDDVMPQLIAHDIHRSGENYTLDDTMELLHELMADDASFVEGYKAEFFSAFSRKVLFQDDEVTVLDSLLGAEAPTTRSFVFNDRLHLVQSEVVVDPVSDAIDRSSLTLEVHRALCVPLVFFSDKKLHVAALGAGAGSLPLFLLHHLPDIERLDAVEPNTHVNAIARKYFGVAEFQDRHPSRLSVHDQMGEQFLENDHLRGSLDLVIIDVDAGSTFDGVAAPPETMLTPSFLALVKRSLSPGGIVAINVIADSTAALQLVQTRLRAVFPAGLTLQLSTVRNAVLCAFNDAAPVPSTEDVPSLSQRLELDLFQAQCAHTPELVASSQVTCW